jgi:hypothetical protein
MNFILIKRDEDVFWMRVYSLDNLIPGTKINNEYGGHQYLIERDIILEKVVAEDWDELDIKKTSGYKEILEKSKDSSLKTGYIDRTGKIWYCEYHAHEALADMLFRTDTRGLDDKGWIKIGSGGCNSNEYYTYCTKRITPEQYKTLSELDYISSSNKLYEVILT